MEISDTSSIPGDVWRPDPSILYLGALLRFYGLPADPAALVHQLGLGKQMLPLMISSGWRGGRVKDGSQNFAAIPPWEQESVARIALARTDIMIDAGEVAQEPGMAVTVDVKTRRR